MAQSAPASEPWQGNLPCCHGPKDGCTAHNPGRTPIFWNPSLPCPVKPVTGGFLKSLLSTKSSHVTASCAGQSAPLQSAIVSVLPQNPSTLEPLPLIHPSVPYTISLYHLHAVTTSDSPTPLLQSLTCHGTTPPHSSPRLSWSVTPLLTPSNTLLLAHAYALSLSPPLSDAATSGSSHGFSYTKRPLLSPIHHVYSFRLCPHATRHVRSVTVKTVRGATSVRVEYSLTNVLGQDFRDQWWSDSGGRQPGNMSCGMCVADFGMRFELAAGGREVRVLLRVWRDLGGTVLLGKGGEIGGGEKWEAARGATALRRERADFGRAGKAFEPPMVLSRSRTASGREDEAAEISSSGAGSGGGGWLLHASPAPPPPPFPQPLLSSP
ncbi:hypothetical protein C8A05DRAFT_17219 [Staphylotrichum tortipilum]|uniref:Uncharacterized protein n=1 Tax=Staphylotrichum tortipilum TaxID=2831512 RepID=A0AAN6MGL4_9PEZI|nr:hypothetical protein C8A05DRAFT_17219 [Staphylotrichum longicolle]